jgi:hypothetical protein
MTPEFEIVRSEGRCALCERVIEEGEAFFSSVFEAKEGFERRDYCLACWDGPPADAYCHFRSRIAPRDHKPRLFADDEVLETFFHRLGEEGEDEQKAAFRFVLTLIMMRKRLLRYEGAEHDGGCEYWQVRLMRDRSLHRVRNPQLDESRINLLTGEIGLILHGTPPATEHSTEAMATGVPSDA